MTDLTNKSITVTKTADSTPKKLILIITWLLSLTLLIAGIVISVDKENEVPVLSAGTLTYTKTEAREYYSYTFTPASNGDYYIYIDGGMLISIKDEEGTNASMGIISSSASYEYIYTVYLWKTDTYTLKVYAKGDEIAIKASLY